MKRNMGKSRPFKVGKIRHQLNKRSVWRHTALRLCFMMFQFYHEAIEALKGRNIYGSTELRINPEGAASTKSCPCDLDRAADP